MKFLLPLLLFCGCTVTRPVSTAKNTRTIRTVQLQQSKTFKMAWDSTPEVEGEVTGIESSNDLKTWTTETSFPLTTTSNYWCDYNPAPDHKFYRAFNQ